MNNVLNKQRSSPIKRNESALKQIRQAQQRSEQYVGCNVVQFGRNPPTFRRN
jgi:hypothetical protein